MGKQTTLFYLFLFWIHDGNSVIINYEYVREKQIHEMHTRGKIIALLAYYLKSYRTNTLSEEHITQKNGSKMTVTILFSI